METERIEKEALEKIKRELHGRSARALSAHIHDVLDKAFGPQRAQALMDQISKTNQSRSFDFLRKVDYKNLLMMIQNEHPQTIAIILSYVNAEVTSQIISELPSDVQLDVIIIRLSDGAYIIRLVDHKLCQRKCTLAHGIGIYKTYPVKAETVRRFTACENILHIRP
jgi:hypothetical protein